MASGFGHNVEVGPEEFLLNFSDAKKAVNIPLIASLNAIYDDTWEEYAKKIRRCRC